MSTIVITCDPEYDLHEAGEDIAEADDFYTAWETAAKSIAQAIGLNARFSRARHGSPEARGTSHHDGEGASLEVELWQAAHDCVRRDADGWKTLSPRTAVVQGLRRFAERLGVLMQGPDPAPIDAEFTLTEVGPDRWLDLAARLSETGVRRDDLDLAGVDLRAPFRCPTCDLPYWIRRTCDGTFDHTTGERRPHPVVDVVEVA